LKLAYSLGAIESLKMFLAFHKFKARNPPKPVKLVPGPSHYQIIINTARF